MSLLQLLIFTNVTTTLSACKRVDVNDRNANYCVGRLNADFVGLLLVTLLVVRETVGVFKNREAELMPR